MGKSGIVRKKEMWHNIMQDCESCLATEQSVASVVVKRTFDPGIIYIERRKVFETENGSLICIRRGNGQKRGIVYQRIKTGCISSG